MPSVNNSTSYGPQQEAEQDQRAIDTLNIDLFKKHTLELFGRTRGGHMARWVYVDLHRGGDLSTGSELWTAFINASQSPDSSYYISRQEIELIARPKTIKTINNLFSKAHRVVDFGSGSTNAVKYKALPIVHGLSNVEIYSPLDISEHLLGQAEELANENSPPDVEPIHADFETGKMQETGESIHFDNPDENRLGLFLGSTITNQEMDIGAEFPRTEIVRQLENFGDILSNGTRTEKRDHGLIVGYDSNHDVESAYAAYEDSPDGPKIWAPLVTGVMFDIKKILDPQPFNAQHCGFDPLGWHHERVVEEGPALDDKNPDGDKQYIVLHQCVVADKRQDFTIGENGSTRRFIVNPGDKFVIKNNFKFNPAFFRQLAREAKFNPRRTIQADGNNMVLQTLDVGY